jgi:hypothetical protein
MYLLYVCIYYKCVLYVSVCIIYRRVRVCNMCAAATARGRGGRRRTTLNYRVQKLALMA